MPGRDRYPRAATRPFEALPPVRNAMLGARRAAQPLFARHGYYCDCTLEDWSDDGFAQAGYETGVLPGSRPVYELGALCVRTPAPAAQFFETCAVNAPSSPTGAHRDFASSPAGMAHAPVFVLANS